MDINLTGALAANVSLMQPTKTDYLPLITQIGTTILTAIVTLGAVFLTQQLASNEAARKHAEEEIKKNMEKRKRVYQKFLTEFSEPLPAFIALDDFKRITDSYLNAALNAAEFGNLRLPYPIENDLNEYPKLLIETSKGVASERPLWTLQDFIEAILNARLWGIGAEQEKYLKAIQGIGGGNFGPLLSKTLLEQRIIQSEAKAKHRGSPYGN